MKHDAEYKQGFEDWRGGRPPLPPEGFSEDQKVYWKAGWHDAQQAYFFYGYPDTPANPTKEQVK